jgi:hypothetical protein
VVRERSDKLNAKVLLVRHVAEATVGLASRP